MDRYGIIDLGSNTIRLCIYEVQNTPRQPLTKKDITTLLNYKAMSGLASFVQDGVMVSAGIQRAIKTINAHLARAEHFSCKRIDVFATAVLRNCKNSAKATAAIEEATNTRITILSNEEEAHLGFLGAKLDCAMEAGTMVDIGGGSTELTCIADGLDLDKISLPQGSLSSYAGHVASILPTKDELKEIAQAFRTLTKKEDITPYASGQLYGIGGAIRAAAKVYGDMCNNGNRHTYLTAEHIDAILTAYEKDPDTFAHQALRTVPDRIHTFLPGCMVIREVFKITAGKRLDICKYGVREGYLAERVLVRPVASPK